MRNERNDSSKSGSLSLGIGETRNGALCDWCDGRAPDNLARPRTAHDGGGGVSSPPSPSTSEEMSEWNMGTHRSHDHGSWPFDYLSW